VHRGRHGLRLKFREAQRTVSSRKNEEIEHYKYPWKMLVYSKNMYFENMIMFSATIFFEKI
jgi:hypothetical protein